MTDLTARFIARLTETQKYIILGTERLDDGSLIVPASSVPDCLTAPYTVHHSRLNRVGLAVRAMLLESRDVTGG